jgi:hypothetical protein
MYFFWHVPMNKIDKKGRKAKWTEKKKPSPKINTTPSQNTNCFPKIDKKSESPLE